MNKRVLEWYQYAAPLILTPLSFWLWWQYYDNMPYPTLVAWLLPILFAYIVPGVGTNMLKVWEFNTRLNLGRFRPHHGFVFGSASSVLIWLSRFKPAHTPFDILKTAFITASILGLWNIIYDIMAIRNKILIVYNQPWADGRDAEAITHDYAPWFFGGFGAIYGASIAGVEWYIAHKSFGIEEFLWYFPSALILSIAIPVIGYRRRSLKIHGHSGCKPVAKADKIY